MSTETIRKELEALFKTDQNLDEAEYAECVNICYSYKLAPEDFFFKWEALKYSSKLLVFTMDSARDLRLQVHRESTAAANAGKGTSKITGGMASVNKRNMPRFGRPAAGLVGKSGSWSGAPVASGSVAGGAVNVAGPSRVVFKGPKTDPASMKKRNYRYMYEKISTRSETLDDQIEEFGELIRKHHNIPELGDPSSSTDDEIVVVGRITLDAESSSAAGVKLNEASLTLECSRMLASGARIRLKFDPDFKIRGGARGCTSVGLFPGAIVALRGKNGSGEWFAVSEVLHPPPLDYAPKPTDPSPAPFSMIIASGPYTPDTDLAYKSLPTLFSELKSKKPDVLLLTGPFVDATHPQIQSGDTDASPSELFENKFVKGIQAYLDASPGSIALVVPSVRDILSSHAVYPQAEFDWDLVHGDPRIHLLPNPAHFTINDTAFTVTTVDVLFHLRREEFLKRGQAIESVVPASSEDTGTDPIGNLSRHLLVQRNLYPLFPVPLDVSRDVNLDVTHAGKGGLAIAGYAPDVLVVPGRLKQFVKRVDGTTVLNPGFATKGSCCVVSGGGGGGGVGVRAEIVKMDAGSAV